MANTSQSAFQPSNTEHNHNYTHSPQTMSPNQISYPSQPSRTQSNRDSNSLTRDNLLANDRQCSSSPDGHGGKHTIAQKQRKYSADLYEYTNKMWATIRQDIDQRKAHAGHQDSMDSTNTSTDSTNDDVDPIHKRVTSGDSVANELGAVPALH